MARIADEELERIKREVSLERLAQARGVKLKRHGADLHGCCPFHDDRTPSLVITPSKNVWHCLGACQAGGSVIDWVMRAEGVSFRHAVELLREDIPSLAASASPAPAAKRSSVKKLETIAEIEEPDAAVLSRVVSYYHATLKESPAALEYLKERGLVHAEVIEHFKLGYANRTLGYRLPDKNRKAGELMRGQLQRLGIFRQSGHEHLSGSFVIPILSADGVVQGMYGRKITAGLREGTPLHLYLPGPHRGVFNVQALSSSREVILCESLIDALTFWCAGHRNVTSAYGVEGFTQELFDALKLSGVQKVLIAYDRDAAGERAAEKLAPELAAAGMEVFRVLFPKGMDANEYALKVQPAAVALGTLVRSAQWLAGSRPVNVPSEVIEALPPTSPHEPPENPPLEASSSGSPAPASASAEAPAVSTSGDVAVEQHDDEVTLRMGDRRWRIRGLRKNMSYEQLRVNVLVSREQDGASVGFHVDTLELYSARQRTAFLKQAEEELIVEERILKHDMGRVLLELEQLQEQQIKAALQPEKKAVEMTEQDREAALALLRDPKLCERILADYERCGVIGEETNKLVGYLAAVSRKLEQPLAVVIQSSSAAGKSSLMEAVLSFVPEEERVHYSAMTGQSLFYMGEMDLAHRILAIAEEQGAQSASYALKLLQSEGELTIASTGKDPTSGRLVTQEYRVCGPVMIFLTTTAIEVDEELLNRCIVLTVDEGREQTRAIHKLQRQRQTLEGLLARQDRDGIVRLHQNAQRLLRPLLVANPFAHELSFIDQQTRTRRDHMKYLTMIRTIALLHQYQRPVKTVEHQGRKLEYIEVIRADIEMANELSHQVLGRSLDELPPQTRRMLSELHAMVGEHSRAQSVLREDFRFSRRMLRERIGWSETQTRVHLERLVRLEYVLPHRGGRGQSFVYELCYEGQGAAGERFFAGAIGAESAPASSSTTSTSRGISGTSRGARGVVVREVARNESAHLGKPRGGDGGAHLERAEKIVSYPKRAPSLVALSLKPGSP